ncbi:Oxysterol-binding protein-related protein 2 [Ophiophagus hannah]|uniref:Oxysterol-binding protein n=1 Tax=Ophiophagus hannah TaxID=8665 RepID=V8NTP7_OPHHA|nr:Oxysterol-binding protein-related protein 2 [Ophiophagus hannah]
MNSEEEFYDAVTGFDSDNSSGEFSEAVHKVDVDDHQSNRTGKHNGDGPVQENGIKKHRTSLPAPMFTRSDFSVWSILKKCIGLELSKITMPIAFNEPLSFLQRITEYMEHTYLINKANCHSNPLERMQAVAAFAVSAVASQWERTGKPFNPLLGETYELIREDLGFRLISEQVSHHPPISAFYSEGLNQDFIFHGSIYPKLKFWGKSVEAEPRGTITLELIKHREAYTWTNPTCCVHNVIIGKLWIEQYGTVEIINHSKKKLSVIYGKWTECLWCIDPYSYENYKKNERKGGDQKKPKPASFMKMYNFTSFTVTLNELEKGMEDLLAPTDCRLRPDIRHMENGEIDQASKEKERLEEKQRAARKDRAKEEIDWRTRWFYQGTNPYTGTADWLYSGGYFDRNFFDCPDIY